MMKDHELIHWMKEEIKRIPQGKLTTPKVRESSRLAFSKLDDKTINHVLKISEELLSEKTWALTIIAYDFAYRVRKQYTKETFDVFEKWLFLYVNDWWDCDDFCTHAFGELISMYDLFDERIIKWVYHEKFAVRRAAAVIQIRPIKKGLHHKMNPFIISDLLMNDTHDLVLKGYGWMLKVLSQKDPKIVFDYLKHHEEEMPRVSFRYACEKLDERLKKELMRKSS